MATAVPTRITIELHPGPEGHGAWTARSEILESAQRYVVARRGQVTAEVPEVPEVHWAPPPYEAPPCTCDAGLCDRDHENE